MLLVQGIQWHMAVEHPTNGRWMANWKSRYTCSHSTSFNNDRMSVARWTAMRQWSLHSTLCGHYLYKDPSAWPGWSPAACRLSLSELERVKGLIRGTLFCFAARDPRSRSRSLDRLSRLEKKRSFNHSRAPSLSSPPTHTLPYDHRTPTGPSIRA